MNEQDMLRHLVARLQEVRARCNRAIEARADCWEAQEDVVERRGRRYLAEEILDILNGR